MTAQAIIESDLHGSPVNFKDLSWLWRTAYNVAVQGCADWEDSEDSLSELFDLSRVVIPPFL